MNRTTATRQDLAQILLEMLENRKRLTEAGKPVQPLNSHELDLLADKANPAGKGGMPSDAFFRYFEAQHGLTLRTGQEQDVKRTANYTQEISNKHFDGFRKKLREMNFVYTKGARNGEIRDECKFGWGDFGFLMPQHKTSAKS